MKRSVVLLFVLEQTQATCKINQKGGTLSLPNIGISLQIPADALPDDTNDVNMTMSLYQEYRDYPDIEATHLMITPIVSCQPEGIVFKQPAKLTLPHSVPRFKSGNFKSAGDANIHLWFKSRKGWCHSNLKMTLLFGWEGGGVYIDMVCIFVPAFCSAFPRILLQCIPGGPLKYNVVRGRDQENAVKELFFGDQEVCA